MEFHPTTTPIRQINLTTRIILFMMGILLDCILFGITVQLFNVAGIWIGLVLSIALALAGFYYTEKTTYLRLISWGILLTFISGTVIFIAGMTFFSKSLEGL